MHGTKNNFKKQTKNLMLLYVLNICDLLFTFYGIRNNYIEEVNPIMKHIYNLNSFYFVLFKFSIPLICLLLIYIFYNRIKWIKRIVLFLNGTYAYIFFLHLYIIFIVKKVHLLL